MGAAMMSFNAEEMKEAQEEVQATKKAEVEARAVAQNAAIRPELEKLFLDYVSGEMYY